MTIGVYLLTHKTSGKCYVGQSKDVTARLKSHRKNSFPKEFFHEDVLEECPVEMLVERENHWMKQLNSLNPSFGYNRNFTTKPRKQKSEVEELMAYQKWQAKRARGY